MGKLVFEERDWWYSRTVREYETHRVLEDKRRFVAGFSSSMWATVERGSDTIQFGTYDGDANQEVEARFMLCEEIRTIFITDVNATIDAGVEGDLLGCAKDLFGDVCERAMFYEEPVFQEMRARYARELCKACCALPFHASVLQNVAAYMKPWWWDASF